MHIITAPHEFNADDLFVDLEPLVGEPLMLKCEGFNFAGSIKLKAARAMVDAAERRGRLRPGSTLVESSSGNLGVALSLLAASRGYRFLCVTDSRCTLGARQLMQALGSEVHVITTPDPVDGLLGARLAHVRELCAGNEDFLWLNQYANPDNGQAHYDTTGPEILKAFPDLSVLFVGAGTTGTLMGCARYLRDHKPSVRVVAVDAEGSVTFGGPARTRMIPGLGTGVRPPLLDESLVDDVVLVAEPDTIRSCRRLARRGFLFGGSTGTVVSGALAWLARHPLPPGGRAVAIAPDLGERYLDTVYQEQWVVDLYGPRALDDDVPARVG
ncbi:2,3-diaminopropionate biosynthesis protein SbnA [Streptomyces endophytica]|uniref:2,3-diaminopropionate biosynthesis protein SbnA n=1 Tax=Streptomyces endophytica TaxID=2991496 RepID=A0ABY6PJN5_9ACTN|nr:2,3-diaminopropionate biosynthesis protein SbnA [Streptomyces endophytica]UZJ34124.1 2,3-diaminopropionate biosynthesis protein SbnA [Streptomyces endophytica]